MVACLVLLLAGCAPKSVDVTYPMIVGEYGRARTMVADNLTVKRQNRQYLLDRMRLGVLTLADGYGESAVTAFGEVYELLRTQGINRDRTVQSVVVNEDTKIWKGEPFEQALAMSYYGLAQAQTGSWDNARAAFGNALFYLRDFGKDPQGQPLDTYAIAQRSLIYERALDAGEDPEQALQEGGLDIDHGYTPTPSNFTLAYLLNAIANQQLGRDDEASDHFARASQLQPGLRPVIAQLKAGDYNTVLVIGYGLGPRKDAYGPDNALARFVPRTPSIDNSLRLLVEGQLVGAFPVVTNVNHMAADHMWNNLEDVRQAKSFLGDVAIVSGAVATAYGIDQGNEAALAAGLGAIALGAFMKAGAHADTRYCDAFPQRYYVVPLMLTEPVRHITLQVEGVRGARLELLGLGPPSHGQAQLRYVRLMQWNNGAGVPAWAGGGEVIVGNPVTGAAQPDPRPYILGGLDAQPPSERTLDQYQAGGNLSGWTLADLQEAYRKERIVWTIEDQLGVARLHVLEGGKSLVAPDGGTLGFTRLFGQLPPPYDR